MTQRRCFPPDPTHPGTLHLLSIIRAPYSVPFQLSCLKGALAKWQKLFTVQILEYSLSDAGVLLMAYVPSKLLTQQEADERTALFDEELQKTSKSHWKLHPHRYSPEKLNSISDFMHDFSRDFRARHKKLPPPKDLPPGTDPLPRQARTYVHSIVQHNALPPILSVQQLRKLSKKLQAIGFKTNAKTYDPRHLQNSTHGIGEKHFLTELEKRCDAYLAPTDTKKSSTRKRPRKKILPFDPQAWDRRLGELISQDPCELYPKAWSLLMGLDMMSDSLLTTECFRKTTIDSPQIMELQRLACLPLSLTLLMTDGLVRWYYKTQKSAEFPRYNWYRKLYPWET